MNRLGEEGDGELLAAQQEECPAAKGGKQGPKMAQWTWNKEEDLHEEMGDVVSGSTRGPCINQAVDTGYQETPRHRAITNGLTDPSFQAHGYSGLTIGNLYHHVHNRWQCTSEYV